MERKLHFYLPKKTADSGTQTLLDSPHSGQTITDRLRESSIDLVLHQEPLPASSSARSLLQSLKLGLGYYITQLKDDRFEMLTPPQTLYQDLPAAFFIEFYEATFLVLNGDYSKSVSFEYERAVLPLVEPLETGVLTGALFAVLEKLQVGGYCDGALLCQVTDFRYDPARVFRMRLAVGSDVIQFHCRRMHKLTADQQESVEAQALAAAAPCLCTDPSPNVARAFSAMDHRAKMWGCDTSLKMDIAPPPEPLVREPVSATDLKKLPRQIKLPDGLSAEIHELLKKTQ